MIPDLVVIVGAYVVVRLLALMAKQAPPLLQSHPFVRWSLALLALLGVVLTILCTVDTLGVGLNFGTSVEEQLQRNRQDFERRELEHHQKSGASEGN